MFNENQLVEMKWNSSNREWFESKGYIFTKRYDVFNVKAKDLSHTSKKRVIATCDYCGKEYETSFAVLINGRNVIKKDCCPCCTGKKTSEVSWRRRAEKYIGIAEQICKDNGYTLLTTIDEYTDIKMDARFVCPIHGVQTMALENIIHGHKCARCSYEQRGAALRHDIEYVVEQIESVNGNKLLNPDDYRDSTTRNLDVLCACGNIFTTSFANYIRYGVTTCYSCSCKESTGEKIIREFLESNKINFEQEKRFDDCRDKKPLPFDFYLPDDHLIIEFDGQHHYENMNYGNLETTMAHDKTKNDYCKSHNIDLLRIPYWEGNNIEAILKDKLCLQVKDIVSSHVKV